MADVDRWHAQIEPLRRALVDLIEARQEHQDGVATADSQAMSEIAFAQRWPNLIAGNPAHHAHTLGNLLLAACEDHLLALCRLVGLEEAVLFSDKVLLRAGLEAAARARWLLDPTLDPTTRVSRGLTEWISSKSRLAEAIPEIRATTTNYRQRMEGRVRDAGLAWTSGGKGAPPFVGRDRYPSASQVLRQLLPYDPDVDEADLGQQAQGFLSLYVHGNVSALLALADFDDEDAPGALGRVGRIGSSAEAVNFCLVFASLGYTTAAAAQMTLLGRPRTTWDARLVNLNGLIQQRIGRADRPPPK